MPALEDCLAQGHVYNQKHCNARITRANLTMLIPGIHRHHNHVREFVLESAIR